MTRHMLFLQDPDHMEMGLGLLDAHALWHAATVPLTFLFYRFLGADLDWWYGKKVRPALLTRCKV